MERWVVIGAGSAGCVLANRLSADGGRHVTLLDDGPDLTPAVVTPAISGPDFLAALDEPGRSHPDLLASRIAGSAPTPYPRGRGIGGSSTVNAMVALAGDRARYEAWGWTDTQQAWEAVRIPVEEPHPDELGPIDLALIASRPDARVAALTRRAGLRVTSAEAYLWPVLDRANLDVRPDSRVERLVFDGRRCAGVLLADRTEIGADRVVLCAGAIHTPALLLHSGVDTPGIGTHLQDHPSAPLTLELRAGHASPGDAGPGRLVVGSLAQIDAGDDIIQFLPVNHLGTAHPGLGMLLVALMTPRGADGTVTIDHDGRPLVDFALLDDERDLAALAGGVRRALDTLDQAAFTEIVDTIYIDDSGTTAAALRDDDALLAWVRTSSGDYVHASSSCAMGRVVDDDYAVIGYDALSICDASVLPHIPEVNTHLPVTMAAERFCRRETMET